jgi:hypothetical protein
MMIIDMDDTEVEEDDLSKSRLMRSLAVVHLREIIEIYFLNGLYFIH